MGAEIVSIHLPPEELLRQVIRFLQTLTTDELANMVGWLQELR